MVNLSNLFDFGRNLYAMPAYQNRSGLAPMPLRYFFELTYRCNLNCPYCYVGNDRVKDELTTDEWYKIIDQIPWYSFVIAMLTATVFFCYFGWRRAFSKKRFCRYFNEDI